MDDSYILYIEVECNGLLFYAGMLRLSVDEGPLFSSLSELLCTVVDLQELH